MSESAREAPPVAAYGAFDALMASAADHFDRAEVNAGLAVYDELLERYGDDPALYVRTRIAEALAFKGHLLFRGPDGADRAIGVFDEIVARFGAATELELREKVARALIWKSAALERSGRREAANDACEELIVRFADATEPALRAQVASAREQQAANLIKLVDLLTASAAELVAGELWEEALEVLDGVVVRFENSTDPALRERVALTLSNSVVALMALGRFDEATAAHREMVARFGDDALAAFDAVARQCADAVDPAQRRHAVGALGNRAGVLRELDRRADALAAFDELIERFEGDRDAAIERLFAQARDHRDELLGGDPD